MRGLRPITQLQRVASAKQNPKLNQAQKHALYTTTNERPLPTKARGHYCLQHLFICSVRAGGLEETAQETKWIDLSA